MSTDSRVVDLVVNEIVIEEKTDLVDIGEKKEGVQRIVTLDFLRGAAIWFMLIVHAIMEMGGFNSGASPEIGWEELAFSEKFFLGLLLYLASFRGLFLLISILVNVYVSHKNLEKGHSPEKILLKQLLMGGLILIIANLFQLFLHWDGLFQIFIYQKDALYSSIKYQFFDFSVLHCIGWSMIIAGVLHYFLALRREKRQKQYILLTSIVYLVLITTIISLTPLVTESVGNYFLNNYGYDFLGIEPQQGQWNLPITSAKEFFARMFFKFLVGHIQPMMPLFATALIGSLIGMHLAQKKPLKLLPLFILIGFVASLSGSLVIIIKNGFGRLRYRPNLGLYLFSLSGQLLILAFFLFLIEYKGYTKRFIKYTKYFRRFGVISLTVFVFQIIDCVPRYFLQFITGFFAIVFYDSLSFGTDKIMDVGWKTAIDVPAALYQYLIATALIVAWWSLIIWLWEKVNFVGTLEWMIVSLVNINKKLPPSSRTKIRTILNNPTPIVFKGIWKKGA